MQGFQAALARPLLLDGVFHQQDGVLGRQAEQHEHADHRRQIQRLAGDHQGDEAAAERQGQGRQDGPGFEETAEQQDHDAVDQGHAGEHGADDAAEQVRHVFHVARRGLAHPGRQVLHRLKLVHLA